MKMRADKRHSYNSKVTLAQGNTGIGKTSIAAGHQQHPAGELPPPQRTSYRCVRLYGRDSLPDDLVRMISQCLIHAYAPYREAYIEAISLGTKR